MADDEAGVDVAADGAAVGLDAGAGAEGRVDVLAVELAAHVEGGGDGTASNLEKNYFFVNQLLTLSIKEKAKDLFFISKAIRQIDIC